MKLTRNGLRKNYMKKLLGDFEILMLWDRWFASAPVLSFITDVQTIDYLNLFCLNFYRNQFSTWRCLSAAILTHEEFDYDRSLRLLVNYYRYACFQYLLSLYLKLNTSKVFNIEKSHKICCARLWRRRNIWLVIFKFIIVFWITEFAPIILKSSPIFAHLLYEAFSRLEL